MTIVSHIIFALFAVGFGTRNLISKKGDNKHKVIGWIWVLLMFYVAISSYWIKELNDGNGNFIGLIVAGIFTLLPGRYLPNLIGIF